MKANQKKSLADSVTISETATPDGVYQEPITKTRNRIESRRAEVFLSPTFTDNDKWDLAEALIKIERKRLVFHTKSKKWENSDETSFYISTTVLSAKEFNMAIRNHQGIENRNHHVRDDERRQISNSYKSSYLCKVKKFCYQYFEKEQCQKYQP